MYTDLNEFLKANKKGDKQIYTFVRAKFSLNGYGYCYLTDSDANAGDLALVKVENGFKITVVTEVVYATQSEAPYDFAKISKVEKIVPYGTPAHKKLLTLLFNDGNFLRSLPDDLASPASNVPDDEGEDFDEDFDPESFEE